MSQDISLEECFSRIIRECKEGNWQDDCPIPLEGGGYLRWIVLNIPSFGIFYLCKYQEEDA